MSTMSTTETMQLSESEIFNRLFGPAGMGLCVKDVNRQVLFQNHMCGTTCGDCKGTVCNKGCMVLWQDNDVCPARAEGVQVFPNEMIEGQYMDVIVLNTTREIITLLYPVEQKHQREFEFLKDKGLSRREAEIAWLVIRGATNSDIVKRLAISKATLKTHLNNVYKKLPADSRVGFRRRLLG